MKEIYEEIKREITLDNKEAYEEFVRILKEKNLDSKKKVIEYCVKKSNHDKYYPGISILKSFYKEFNIPFYDELRKHIKEDNKEFIEEFIYYLYSNRLFNKKSLIEYCSSLKTLEERIDLSERKVSFLIQYIHDDHIDSYNKKIDNVRNSKTLSEKIYHIIEMEYFFSIYPSLMDYQYEYILLDKFSNMNKAWKNSYDEEFESYE